MKIKTLNSLRLALGASLIFIGLTACDGGNKAAIEAPVTAETVIADGSSTVYPITREAARRFGNSARDADIRVQFSGTSAGLRKFCAGETDISNASRILNDEERELCAANGIEFLQLPVAMDTLAVVVHFDNRWAKHLTLEELKRIWEPAAEGVVTRWNQVREDWPDQPIVLFGRGQDSGTYDYFTQHVVGAVGSSRMDYIASEDEEYLAAGIAAEPNSLGFFGVGAYHRHWDSLKLVAIDAGNGAVYPSLETAVNGTYKPLSRQLYLYVNKSSLKNKPHLADFLEHYFTGLNRWLHLTGYIPLHEDV